MDKIKVIKLKKEGYRGLPRYRIIVGDRELAHMVTGVKATLDPNTNLITVNMEFVTDDFEWKGEE